MAKKYARPGFGTKEMTKTAALSNFFGQEDN